MVNKIIQGQGSIYLIVCKITGKRYVGSTFNPEQRLMGHKKGECSSHNIIDNYFYDFIILWFYDFINSVIVLIQTHFINTRPP